MKKVLIADDDRTTLLVMSKIVEHIGAAAVLCSDGLRAIQTLQDNNDFSLLITDYVMPNIGGNALVQQARELYSPNELKIIVVSGLVRVSDINNTLNLGVKYFIPKPIDRKSFEEYVKSCLDLDSHSSEERYDR